MPEEEIKTTQEEQHILEMAKKKNPNQTLFKTVVNAEFIYPEDPKTPEETAHRAILKRTCDKACERLQPIFRLMLIEMLEAQSKHYTTDKKEG